MHETSVAIQNLYAEYGDHIYLLTRSYSMVLFYLFILKKNTCFTYDYLYLTLVLKYEMEKKNHFKRSRQNKLYHLQDVRGRSKTDEPHAARPGTRHDNWSFQVLRMRVGNSFATRVCKEAREGNHLSLRFLLFLIKLCSQLDIVT